MFIAYFYAQCWGKLLLKVMHYDIALLPKDLMEMIALRYFCVTF